MADLTKMVKNLKSKSKQSKRLTNYHSVPMEWELKKDAKGREIGAPIFNGRERSWSVKCLDFGYTLDLLAEELLTEFQKDTRDRLASGRVNALLHGPPGNGKTTVGMLALREIHMAGSSVKATRFSDFKTRMEPNYCNEREISPTTVMVKYTTPQFLLIDELGYIENRKTATEHECKVFFDLISARYSRGFKTWILANIGRDDLYNIYGEATLSRVEIIGESVTAHFQGIGNYRLSKPVQGSKV